jgi:hypothetical protein
MVRQKKNTEGRVELDLSVVFSTMQQKKKGRIYSLYLLCFWEVQILLHLLLNFRRLVLVTEAM